MADSTKHIYICISYYHKPVKSDSKHTSVHKYAIAVTRRNTKRIFEYRNGNYNIISSILTDRETKLIC